MRSVRANLAEMAEAAEAMPPAVQEAVRVDAEAMEATADPSAFGFVVREAATGAVLVCIRGTQTPREWLANFTAVPNTFSLVPDFGLVHLGFERMYSSVRRSIQQVLAGIDPDVRVTALGHSLGGAMATLAAVDFKRNLGRRQVDLCTIGGPRVGKFAFRRNFNREIPLAFRVTNQFDIVPHVPSLVTGWNHVGEEIEVDGNVDGPHSLVAYLAGLRNVGVVREVSPFGVLPEMAAVPAVMSLRVP
jgi:triacylglycerol lipase